MFKRSIFLFFALVFIDLNMHAELPLRDDFCELKGSLEHVLKRVDRWVKRTTRKVESRSKVIETSMGPVEYTFLYPRFFQNIFKPHFESSSKLPIVLSIHGGFGGFDQGEVIASNLPKAGFVVLSPSRPGYLRTPLSDGQTNAQQADVMVALLDALKIDQVAALGFSAGSQIAFEMAIRHPTRVWAIVLECLGAQPSQAAEYHFLTELLESPAGEILADFASYEFFLLTKYDPKLAVEIFSSIDTDLPPKPLERRVQYVQDHRSQFEFTLGLIKSTEPISPRSPGIVNDIGPNNLDPWPTFPYNLLKTPTIIIQAVNDDNGSYPEAQWVALQITGSKFLSIKDSGHFIWLGPHTKRWEKKLNKFLDAHSP